MTAGGGPVLLAGRYELGPELGRGSSAAVHRAHDRLTGADVAVKRFTSATGGPRDRREVEILAGLRHPGLAALRDALTVDDRLVVVTDLVDGESLADRLRRGPMPAADVAAVGAGLADALAHVHGRDVVHRDVKPANILLDRDGRPRLVDFGIARLVDATRVTGTGVVVGTAGYMAPEQVRGSAVGPPADVYALGLVLLEAATGIAEYPGPPIEAAIARLHRPPVVPAGLPPGLAVALRGMTATEPDERPTAAAAARLLRAPDAPAGRRATRRLIPMVAASVLATALVGGYALIRPSAEVSAASAAPPAAAAPAAAPAPGIPTEVPVAEAPPAEPRPAASAARLALAYEEQPASRRPAAEPSGEGPRDAVETPERREGTGSKGSAKGPDTDTGSGDEGPDEDTRGGDEGQDEDAASDDKGPDEDAGNDDKGPDTDTNGKNSGKGADKDTGKGGKGGKGGKDED